MSKLEGKVALVSGSGRGIGRAVALKLAREGARIVVNDLDSEPAQAVVEEIRALGSEAVACIGDVAAPDFGTRFVQTALTNFGGIDIIVNNAGYTWDNVIQKMSDEQFEAMFNVHLMAPFRILRAAAEPLRAAAKKEAAEGKEVIRKVVNISSVAGLYGNSGQVNYSMGKAGIVGLTRTLCKEWGRYKVTVNCVAFGYIKTRLTQPITTEQATIDVAGRDIQVGIQSNLIKTFEQLIPLGRAGEPEEAADAVYLFCSPESNYISGQVVVCGGGLLV
ncbi:MAG: SDR family oxidoreductase [Chloroflexi bacterium]|nr:SDR family oxidoreductase [Chloroflexota bacterium]OJV92165.1 MAG: 3-oxoacyl-ACP reductase [Chloroflexi bacterium 54-19]